jgi:hypothetical protein
MIAGPFILKGQSSKEQGNMASSAPESARQRVAPIYPVKISANHRYLVDQNQTPYLIQGEAAWELIVNLNDAAVEQYLRNRKEKGFNSVIVNLIEHRFSKKPPLNAAGDAPFTTPGDFTTPNEKYFAHADWVIRKAGEYGIQVLLYPLYLGYKGTTDGWIEEVLQNGPAKCLHYGLYVGNRYKNFDNIIWVMGADRSPESALADVDMVALGIKENDHHHLMTAHSEPEHTAMDRFGSGRWLDLDTVYTYQLVHDSLLENYNSKPIMPYFLIESTYEGEHDASEAQIRRQAYWAVLCGGVGHFFGDNPIWHFDAPGFFDQFASGVPPAKRLTWQQSMDLPGSVGMMYWGALFRSRAWYDLVPDQEHKVVTAGLGEFRGLDYLAAARTSDGSAVIAYMPSNRKITVDMGRVSGSQAKAWWFDPRNGKASAAGEFPTTRARDFTPPAEGDWVLVLDDAARRLPAPGASQ